MGEWESAERLILPLVRIGQIAVRTVVEHCLKIKVHKKSELFYSRKSYTGGVNRCIMTIYD